MLKIPYTNAKVIFRGYKVEKKVLSNQKRIPHKNLSFDSEFIDIDHLREETFRLLIHSIDSGIFSERIVNKLKMNNARVLLKLTNLDEKEDRFEQTFPLSLTQEGHQTRVLPIPADFHTRTPESLATV